MSVYLITGAAGYIGSMLTEYLLENDHDCHLIAVVRHMETAKERLLGRAAGGKRHCQSETDLLWDFAGSRLKLFEADLCDRDWTGRLWAETGRIDYIIHCASVTQSSEMVSHPVEVTDGIVNGTRSILEAGRRYKIKSMVCLSSMEVYGSIDCADHSRIGEEEAGCGSVELLNARSCYPLGKRMAENLCYSYFKEYGVPVKIARLSQVFGRGVLPSDGRIFAQFARAVKENTDIVLHTDGTSVGNYCAVDDALTGILTILKRGQDGEAYNVVNEENTMTIRQMAELVRDEIAGGRIEVIYDIAEDNRYGYGARTGLRLSGEKLQKLGWRPGKNLTEMYRDMLEHL